MYGYDEWDVDALVVEQSVAAEAPETALSQREHNESEELPSTDRPFDMSIVFRGHSTWPCVALVVGQFA